MRTKLSKLEVIVMCFLSLIPWPGPSVFKISCSRESACVVRKIIQSKWIPILDKYQVKIPLECPFHPLRDIFGPQQMAKKQNRPSQWTCGFCGKSFYEEKYLDMHFENRHKNKINMAEDAICLADYCDIMRCEVLLAKDSTLSFGDSNTMSTDIEIWNEATAYRTALQQTGRRDLAKISNTRTSFLPLLSRFQKQSQKSLPKTSTSGSLSGSSSATTSSTQQGSSPSSAGGARNKNGDTIINKSPKFNNCIKLDIKRKKNNKKNNVISKYNKIKNKVRNQENGNANDDDDDDDDDVNDVDADDEDLNENSFNRKLNNGQKPNTNKNNLKSYKNIGDDNIRDEDEDEYDDEDDENNHDNDDDDADDDDDEDEDDEDDDDDDDDEDEQDINSTSPACSANLVDSSLPPINRKHKKILKQQKKITTDCKAEDLEVLKRRCEILVRDCIVGLLLQLSNADFRKMEDELNRSVCWYLTCDRYWEDGPTEQKAFPWGLVLVLVMILSLGVCFCYYIIWILFDSDDNSISKNIHHQQYHYHHHSPSHQQHYLQQQQQQQQHHQHQLQPQQQQQQQQQFSSSSLMVPTDQKGIGGGGGGSTAVGASSSNTSSSIFPLDQQQQQQQQQYPIGYTEDVYAAPTDFNDVAQNEHYIYVTYPPELKRRLFESCYNRTTRL